MTRHVAIIGTAAALAVLWSVEADAQCATFIPGAPCAPARGPLAVLDFTTGGGELQAPRTSPAPPPAAAAVMQALPAPADCNMRVMAVPDVDPRFARPPAADVHYAIRSIEAPACAARARDSEASATPGMSRHLGPRLPHPAQSIPGSPAPRPTPE